MYLLEQTANIYQHGSSKSLKPNVREKKSLPTFLPGVNTLLTVLKHKVYWYLQLTRFCTCKVKIMDCAKRWKMSWKMSVPWFFGLLFFFLFSVSSFLCSSDLKRHKWVWFDVTGCFHPNGNRIKTPCRGSGCQISLPGHFCGKTHNMSAVKIIFTQPTHQTHRSYWSSSLENTHYVIRQHFTARLVKSLIYLNGLFKWILKSSGSILVLNHSSGDFGRGFELKMRSCFIVNRPQKAPHRTFYSFHYSCCIHTTSRNRDINQPS